MNAFLIAINFLTIFPFGKGKKVEPRELAASMAYFPLVGLWLGAMLWALDTLLCRLLPQAASSMLVIAALALATGALHLDGFADTVDGIFGGRGERERILAIMKDSRAGAIGVVALVLLLMTKYAALSGLGAPLRGRALLVMPALSRWSQVQMAMGARYARREGSLARPFTEYLEWRHYFFATVVTAAVVFLLAGTPGFAAFAATALLTMLARLYFHRVLDGVTGDTIGAVSELNEVVIFLVFAASAGLSL